MAYAIGQMAHALKAAREAKSLSQRALAKLAGVPQSHISNIESGAVDLRLSSLVEIARALDLEVTLVPRKSLVAVQSIVRGSGKAAPAGASDPSTARELRKLQDTLSVALNEHPTVKELARLLSSVRDLQRLAATQIPNLTTVREAIKTVQAFKNDAAHVGDLRHALSSIQSLRNMIVHGVPRIGTVKPAYSLEEDDDG